MHREISLNQIIIEPHDSLKVLRVTIDNTLSWREQCNNTAKKTFGALARLCRCQGYLPDNTKLMLIKSLVFPYLDYCARIFWTCRMSSSLNSVDSRTPPCDLPRESRNLSISLMSMRRKRFFPIKPTKKWIDREF